MYFQYTVCIVTKQRNQNVNIYKLISQDINFLYLFLKIWFIGISTVTS